MASRPIDQDDRDRVAELHAAGHSRNDIARQIGRSVSTVTKIAGQLSLTFDRRATKAATEAAAADNAARRAALIARSYSRAEAIFERLEATAYRFTATTVDGIETAELGHVPAQDEKALAQAIGTHVGNAAKMQAVDADTHGLAAVDQWLRGITGG